MKRPPGPRTVRMLTSLARARGDSPQVFARIARQYGDIAYFRVGPASFYLLSSPELVKDVLEMHDGQFERIPGERRVSGRLLHEALFASEGEIHARQRRLMEPVMYREAPPTHASTVVEFAERMTEEWAPGQRVDVYDAVERMTTSMMTKVLFGEDVKKPAGRQLARAMVGAIDALNDLAFAPTSLPDRLPFPSRRRFRRALAELHRLADDVIARRKVDVREDIVSMLLRPGGGEVMSDVQVRDEAIGLFRGQQGVPAALSWTWHLLSENSDHEDRFLSEIDGVLRKRVPTARDLARLPFTRMVFREALRLYPPAWILARKAVADYPVGDFVVPAGASVLVSEWVLHRDPRFWEAPQRFDPERFTSERFEQIPAYAYFPQGAGSKRCMGMEFLPMEAVLVLATVGRRWRLRPAPGHRVRRLPKITLKPRGGMPMVLEPRS